MKRFLLAIPFALLSGCSAPATKEGPADKKTALDDSLALGQAQRLIASQNYHEALAVTDELLARNSDNRAARLLAAEANLGLAELGKNTQAFLLDARSNLEAAAKLNSDGNVLLKLSDIYLKLSEFDLGRDTALAAAKALRDRRAGSGEVATALLAAADCEMQNFVEQRKTDTEKVSEATMNKAQAVLALLGSARPALPGKAATRTAAVYQWLGQYEPALAELERGMEADPTEPDVHIAYQNFMLGSDKRAECVTTYKRMIAARGESATMTFYLGRAQFAAADGLRSRSQWDEAVSNYQAARECFAKYLDARRDHKATATHWMAMCDLSMARIALDRGDHARARTLYDQAFATDPRVLPKDGETQVVDSFGGTYAGGLFMIGTALAEGSSQDALRKALAFFEEIIAKHPGQLGPFYNNAGLAARDLGTAVAASNPQEAMQLWERSYQHYAKAVELVPDDPRIVNDCGLMLVYHLKRDDDKALAMFDKAIALGEEQLASLSEDASREQRQFLEEAVGDAYQNIAVLRRRNGAPFADYKPQLESAVKFYPYQNRQAAAWLRSGGKDADADQQAGQANAQLQKQQARFAALAATAKQQAAEGDYDAALLTLDAGTTELSDFAPFRALVGRMSLDYAKQAQARGGKLAQIDGLFADAASHLQKARELDGESSETRFWLARVALDTGRFADAHKEAVSLLSHIRSRGSADGVDLDAVHALRGEAGARSYIEAKQQGGDQADALRGARESFRLLQDGGKLDAASLRTWLALEQWAGAPDQAIEVASKVAANSRSGDLLDQAVSAAAQLGGSQKLVAALAGSSDATRQWYHGKALFNLAQEQWGNDKAAAAQTLEAASAAFAAAKATNPAYADTCEQWAALCTGSKGIVQLSADDLAGAQTSLLAALTARPDVAKNDLGGGNSIKRAVLVLGSKFGSDQQKLTELMRLAHRALPDDVDFANNLGLAARDFGNQLERRGDKALAMPLYEESYAAYVVAARLDPSNIRLRNDRALMLLYHLHRDLDDAKATLEQARDDGLARLENEPPAGEQERQDLEEAIGDCIENLGYYYDVHAKDNDQAIATYKQSLEFHPKTRRAAARRLRQLGNDK